MIKKKLTATLALSLVAAACVVGGALTVNNVTSANAEGNPQLSSFKMVAGAEIRTADPNGIRFTTEISAQQYDALMERDDYTSVEFGTIICPSYYVTGDLTLETEQAKWVKRTTWDVDYNPTAGTEVYHYNGDLVNILDANFVQEFQAIGYCTVTPVEGEAVTYYATVENEGDNARTPLYVATYNIVNCDNDSDYLLAMVDTAMANNTLALSETRAEVEVGEAIDLPKATVIGNEVVVEYSSENSAIAKVEDGKIVGVKMGSTKLIATMRGKTDNYIAEIPVTVSANLSRFESKTSRTVKDINGTYEFTQHAYYEKGVGVWMYGVATHPGNNGVEGFAPTVGGVAAKVYMNKDIPVENFDKDQTTIWAEEVGDGVYKTSFIGLVPHTALTETTDWLTITAAFDNSTNGEIWIHEQTNGNRTWWGMSQSLIGANGWFETKGNQVDLDFTDDKYGFTWSATLNEYGMYFKAEVKTDTNAGHLRVEITKAYSDENTDHVDKSIAALTYMNEDVATGIVTCTVNDISPTWFAVAKYNPIQESYRYQYRRTYELFLSYEKLATLGVTEFYDGGDGEAVDIDSTLYMNAVVAYTTSATWTNWLDYEDGIEQVEPNSGNCWRHSRSWWSGVSKEQLPYYRKAITKEGMQN